GGAGVGRADLQQEIRPQPRLFDQRVLDELPRSFVGHNEERAHEVPVVGKNSGVEIEDAHDLPHTRVSFSSHATAACMVMPGGKSNVDADCRQIRCKVARGCSSAASTRARVSRSRVATVSRSAQTWINSSPPCGYWARKSTS